MRALATSPRIEIPTMHSGPTTNETLSPAKIAPPVEKVKLELETNVENSIFTSQNLIKWTVDALIRGLARFGETFCNSPFLRIPVRLVSEAARKGVEILGIKRLNGETLTNTDYKIAAVRTLENTVASAFFEPNTTTNRLARVLLGAGNMLMRFATRGAMFFTNIIGKDLLELELLPDQLLSRSIPRLISTISDRPEAKVLTRVIEQLIINPLNEINPVQRVRTHLANKKDVGAFCKMANESVDQIAA